MRDVCQLNVIKATDPRLCILRHTKNWRAFEYRLLGTLGPVEIAKLRKICIVMLNIYLLERPNYQFRQLLLQQTQSITKKRRAFHDLVKQRKEVSAKLNAYVTTNDLAAKRKRVQELSEIVRSSVIREEAKKAAYKGNQFFPYFSQQELEAAEEIRTIKAAHVLDEDGNVALPAVTKGELADRLASIRANMMDTGKAIATETDQQV